jgi:hypothetical protein
MIVNMAVRTRCMEILRERRLNFFKKALISGAEDDVDA